MKKLMMLAFIAILVIPFVYAEEDTDLLAYEKGAEVRLLQLERAIEVNERTAERIIERLVRDNEANTTELEELLEELRVLKSKSSDMRENLAEYDREESVREFVNLRTSVNEVSREFRLLAISLLRPEAVSELRNERAIIRSNHESNERVREVIREHNAERMEVLGSEVEDVQERVRDGELTSEEARNAIRERVSSEEIQEAARSMREEAERIRDMARALDNETKDEFRETVREIAQERTRELRDIATREVERFRAEFNNMEVSDVDMAWYNRAITLDSERVCGNISSADVKERCESYFEQRVAGQNARERGIER